MRRLARMGFPLPGAIVTSSCGGELLHCEGGSLNVSVLTAQCLRPLIDPGVVSVTWLIAMAAPVSSPPGALFRQVWTLWFRVPE